MYDILKSTIKMRVILYVLLIPVISLLSTACSGVEVTGEAQCDQTTNGVDSHDASMMSPALSGDPIWQESEGFTLFAIPTKPEFTFGEKILINLTLKNEIDMDLQYSVSVPKNIYKFEMTDSNGVTVPARFYVESGSFTTGKVKAGKSTDQEAYINDLFKFTLPGTYTGRAWRNVRKLDGTGYSKIYSNKFTFVIYGDPTKADNYRVQNKIIKTDDKIINKKKMIKSTSISKK